MKRRHSLALVATGSLALAGGVWWQNRGDGASGGDGAALAPLWALRLPRPDGTELQVDSLRGKPLLINFWATWCAPCIREMPEIEQFFLAHRARGWQVLGLAIDRPEPVRDFLKRQPVSYTIGLAGLEGTQLLRELGNPAGSLPFSLVVDAQGQIRERKLGQTSLAEMTGWAAKL